MDVLSDVLLAVHHHIADGWHIYWKNPGDSGSPTRVTWHLPEGFKASELMFPIPHRFDQPGDVVGYGYQDEVLFKASIEPPKDLAGNQPVQLSADVSWLVCEKVCIPGKVTVSKSLPVGDARSTHAELFETWSQRFPGPAGAMKPWVKEAGISADGAFVVWSNPPIDVHWFPVPPADAGVENEQTKTEGDRSTYLFSLVPKPKPGRTMQFLVTFKDSQGKQRGVEFAVNLPPAAQ